MPLGRFAVGRPEEASDLNTLRAAMAEFLSTLIFVFAGEGAAMAFSKLTGGADTTPSGLVAIALANGIALFVAVAVAWNISGGHVNPAITFGALIGGHITLLRAILYWIAQLLGAAIACLLLRFTTGGMHTGGFRLSHGVGEWNAVVFEIVMTFGLVYTVYATALDPKKGDLATIGPIAIGLIVGANILAGGPFSGASMNPARAFGPALVSWAWRHHWIYWVGPFVGAGLAGIIYAFFMIRSEPTHRQPLATEDY
ncbi:hypothetical protein KI387_033057 [Taxus chinensis]|uniref:Tonoplast intrinsic protein n=1 Tax=Taxus chinensis TaxID=29808 RepID=A0AA38F4R7_TAXCH|nr:hypothetical protein KI387_033057 [Taxus chinensis]